MNAVIGLLILCGTYSTHSASVSVPLSSRCSGQEDGVLFPVQGKCSQFYICLSGKEVLQNCGLQLHFDAKNRECIEESKSACVDGQWPASLESEIEEKPSVEPTNICSGKATGSFLPSKTSCSDFYVCAGNKAMLKSCQEGYHFDADVNACIRAHLSKCVVKVDKPVEEAAKPEKPILADPTGTTVFAETICLGQPNGAKFAAPGSCSKYFTCLQHKGYEKSCGLRHFDPLARTCIDAKSSDCVEVGDVINNLAVEAAETAQDLTNATTGADVAKPGKYIVVGGKVVQIKKTGLPVIKITPSDNKIIPIKQTPAATQLEADIDNLDIVEITMDVDGDLSASDSGVDIGIVDEKTRAGNKGVFIGSGNIDINNEGDVSGVSVIGAKNENNRAGNTGVFFGSENIDINNGGSVSGVSVISAKETANNSGDSGSIGINNEGSAVNASIKNTKTEHERAGNKGVFVGSGNIDINNEGDVSGVSVVSSKDEKKRAGNTGAFVDTLDIYINNKATVVDSLLNNDKSLNSDKTPESGSAENESEIVIAVVDESSAEQCVGVPSGSLLPKSGNCREFLTCEDGVAYVGQCPAGLHYNKALKICDWPELAGCA